MKEKINEVLRHEIHEGEKKNKKEKKRLLTPHNEGSVQRVRQDNFNVIMKHGI